LVKTVEELLGPVHKERLVWRGSNPLCEQPLKFLELTGRTTIRR
jgi:hypothetical protein